MSDFKSGDEVFDCGVRYIYLCEHQSLHGRSVVQRLHYSGDIKGCKIVKTADLYSITKTHIVNGFEVPAPMTEEEFDHLDENDIAFCFAAGNVAAFTQRNKFYISKQAVKCGLVFKAEDGIKKNILAMQGIDPDFEVL